MKPRISTAGAAIKKYEGHFKRKNIIIHEVNGEGHDGQVGPADFLPISKLGQGSFGLVLLVEMVGEGAPTKKKKKDQKLFALKILNKRQIMQLNIVKYAQAERNILSYTKHPFIVGMKYAFQTPDKLFLVLDFAPGGNMGQALKRERRFPEDRAKIYLAEIILAIEDLHKRNIIFRDLKPDNIVFDEDGHALLTDFGLSKEGIDTSQRTQSFCGSPAYLAPEMLIRKGHGKAVDWYLAGVLLYEMLVGVPPYYNDNK